MGEENKDLTGLLQYSKKLEEKGELPAAPTGAVMEEMPIEKVDQFETLEEYAVTNPPPELSQEPVPSPSLLPQESQGTKGDAIDFNSPIAPDFSLPDPSQTPPEPEPA